MSKNRLSSILGAASVAVLLLSASCKKDSDQLTIKKPTISPLTRTTECCCKDSSVLIHSGWVDSVNVGDPNFWTPVYFSFCDGSYTNDGTTPASFDVIFSSQFDSYLTGNGWEVKYLNETNVPVSAFTTVSCSDISSYATSVQSSQGNTIGAQDIPTGWQGWYVYNHMNPFTVNPSRLLVLSRTCNGVTQNYVVKLSITVGSQLSGSVRQYRADIHIDYRCVSGC